MSNLAINGGKPICSGGGFFKGKPLYNIIKIRHKLDKIFESEQMSSYRGSAGAQFWGGYYVNECENKFEYNYTGLDNSVLAVNSCTSALIIACGAIGLHPGDEVIVTPWSMSCSATAPMVYGAKPVFADIEKDYFCLDPNSIKSKITSKTKAIIIVDLFGQIYNVEEITKIAKKHNLFVIEDAAQAIGAYTKNKYAGCFGDISCFSFTQGKHLSCGEGGFIVTANEDLYMKCALLRNHSDAVISSSNYLLSKYFDDPILKMPGYNMRMTELQAAVLSVQLDYFHDEVDRRIENVAELKKRIKLPGIRFAKVRKDYSHSYYVLAFHYDKDIVGVKRERFLEAVRAELTTTKDYHNRHIGVPIWSGYINPLYNMPVFLDRAIEKLPVTEHLQNEELFISLIPGMVLTKHELDMIGNAFNKVYDFKEEL